MHIKFFKFGRYFEADEAELHLETYLNNASIWLKFQPWVCKERQEFLWIKSLCKQSRFQLENSPIVFDCF